MLNGLSYFLALTAFLTGLFLPGHAEPLLQGGVALSDQLPPVSAELMPGSVFDTGELPAVKTHPTWIRIPGWLAGTWETKEETIINYKDVQTGKAVPRGTKEVDIGKIVWGFQQDAKGDIWHLTDTTGLSTTGGDLADDHNYALQDVVEAVSELRVLRKGELQTYKVAHGSNKILEVAQQEQLQTYMPLRKDVVQIETEMRVFDPKGKMEAKGHTRTLSYRTRSFEPLNGDNNILRTSFEKYLRANDMSDLIR